MATDSFLVPCLCTGLSGRFGLFRALCGCCRVCGMGDEELAADVRNGRRRRGRGDRPSQTDEVTHHAIALVNKHTCAVAKKRGAKMEMHAMHHMKLQQQRHSHRDSSKSSVSKGGPLAQEKTEEIRGGKNSQPVQALPHRMLVKRWTNHENKGVCGDALGTEKRAEGAVECTTRPWGGASASYKNTTVEQRGREKAAAKKSHRNSHRQCLSGGPHAQKKSTQRHRSVPKSKQRPMKTHTQTHTNSYEENGYDR